MLQTAQGSRGDKLNAAYVEAGRHVARMAQMNPSARSFKLDTARGISFDDGGVRTSLSLFHLVSFAEKLKGTNQVDQYDIKGSTVTMHFNQFGLDSLHKFSKAVKPEVGRKQGDWIQKARILEMMQRFEESTKKAPEPIKAAKPAPERNAKALLGMILQTLAHGPRSAEETARLVSIRARVPMEERSQPWLDNGVTFDEAVRHAINHLIERRLLAHPTRQIGLTAEGRKQADAIADFKADTFVEPEAVAKKPKAPEKSGPTIRVMTEQDLADFMTALPSKSARDVIVIWRNAVRITGDESLKAYHHQARVMLRIIENEWNDRADKANIVDSFKWPDASARNASVQKEEGKGKPFDALVGHGMLKELGYSVGRNGVSKNERQGMLSEIFKRTLPPVFDRPYMDQWGPNGSARRLHKIADCLASFARNAARMPGNYDEAISDWQDDLQYLYETHYVGKYGFGWPKGTGEHQTPAPGRR